MQVPIKRCTTFQGILVFQAHTPPGWGQGSTCVSSRRNPFACLQTRVLGPAGSHTGLPELPLGSKIRKGLHSLRSSNLESYFVTRPSLYWRHWDIFKALFRFSRCSLRGTPWGRGWPAGFYPSHACQTFATVSVPSSLCPLSSPA